MLIPLLSLAYAGVVLYNVFVVNGTPYNTLYALHPICACLFIVFATLGMSAAQGIRGKVAQSMHTKEPYITRHAIYNWLALFSLAGASATIYLNKERNSRPHFATYHGITGGLSGAFFVGNVLGGASMNALPSLSKYLRFHRLNGYLIYSALLAAHGTAVWRGYAGFAVKTAADSGSSGRIQDLVALYGRHALVALLGLIWLSTTARMKLSLLPGGGGGDKKVKAQ
ncbi:hypothetical protein Agub_g8145 [Astrephomene gubernaculifera]|uniref:Cytochrome b561 domain-containing protein n=1 Tax=Astrephomene gubernaculifera TaxID=47775 RepID=A0AAD3HN03_9CHLO|nr:hypothetical protein Agub_g8145 [Astrephomene gubernaculifera]